MVRHSPAQLDALALIRFWGLDVYGDLADGGYAIARLNLPPGIKKETINRATARSLAREKLIEEVPQEEDPDGISGRWRVARLGELLLRENPACLERAGRDHARVMGSLALAELRSKVDWRDLSPGSNE